MRPQSRARRRDVDVARLERPAAPVHLEEERIHFVYSFAYSFAYSLTSFFSVG